MEDIAADTSSTTATMVNIEKRWYHDELPLCHNRAPYRQGRKLTAVKVYTILDESCHLLLRNVACIDIDHELGVLCSRYGRVRQLRRVDAEYGAAERFTRVYHVQYQRISCARRAKRHLDGRSFYGSSLVVCYAAELETTAEILDKLTWRRACYLGALKTPLSGVPMDTTREPGQNSSSDETQLSTYLRQISTHRSVVETQQPALSELPALHEHPSPQLSSSLSSDTPPAPSTRPLKRTIVANSAPRIVFNTKRVRK